MPNDHPTIKQHLQRLEAEAVKPSMYCMSCQVHKPVTCTDKHGKKPEANRTCRLCGEAMVWVNPAQKRPKARKLKPQDDTRHPQLFGDL